VKRSRWSQLNPFRDVPRTLQQWRTIRRGWLKVAVFILLAAGLISLPYLIAKDDLTRPPVDEQLTTLTLPPGVTLDSLQEAEVHEVIDGDTIDVLIDGILARVRYFGVDTPERGRICYRESLDRNAQLLGDTVLLLPDVRDQDEGGRLLRYVFLPDGTSVDATLVAEGFGEAWTRDGRYRDQIVELQKEAEAAQRGCLWAP
jgi:endonuclease YncB( thermonuclease family)